MAGRIERMFMVKSVFLVVEHNEGEMRDLRDALLARYSSECEVHAVATAQEARNELTALAAAGILVALVLAARGLPDGDPIVLLNQARELHPSAKRVLIAHFLDPMGLDVISTAMKRGRIDYFLNKPWEPRLDRLYPIVDDLLAASRAANPQRGFEAIRIVGDPWAPISQKLRDILDRSTIPHGFYSHDSDAGKKILAAAGQDGSHLPVLAFASGAVLVQPTNEQIVQALGAKTRPDSGLYDVAIVGGGPAGLAAAVYAASEGLRTLILERETIGGQAGTSAKIDNYLGFPRGISGKELARRSLEQAWRFGVSIVFTKSVSGLRADGEKRFITLSDGSEVESRTVIIATGVAYGRLQVPGIERLLGAGVFYGAPMSEAPAFTGQDVVIVGGGNSAGQAALHLARYAARVTMLVRGPALAASMSAYLVHQISATPAITVRTATSVVEGHGENRLEAVTVERAGGHRERLPAAGLFVLIGGIPHTQWLPEGVGRNAQGYVLTGRDLPRKEALPGAWTQEREPYFLETSVPGVFAAGDVRCNATKRVATAVGEGATAVQLVHEYLLGLSGKNEVTALHG